MLGSRVRVASPSSSDLLNCPLIKELALHSALVGRSLILSKSRPICPTSHCPSHTQHLQFIQVGLTLAFVVSSQLSDPQTMRRYYLAQKKNAAPCKQVYLFCKIDENIDYDGPLIYLIYLVWPPSAAITAAILLCMDL